eukprot:7642089-Alexandrium_andersonii.AAC.1
MAARSLGPPGAQSITFMGDSCARPRMLLTTMHWKQTRSHGLASPTRGATHSTPKAQSHDRSQAGLMPSAAQPHARLMSRQLRRRRLAGLRACSTR